CACLRCFVLAVLLTGEVIFLTLRFDTEGLDLEPRWWASWMGEVYWLPRFAVAMGGVVLLFAGKVLWKSLPGLATKLQPLPRLGLFLFGHFLSFVLFAWVTACLFDTDTRASAHAGFAVAAWWVLGFLSVGFLALAAFPGVVWAQWLWEERRVLAAAAVVALMACAFGWAVGVLWWALGQGTVWAAAGLLRLLGVEIVYDPVLLEVGTVSFTVEIGPACSGYEGIGLFWTFLGIYFWLFRKELCFPQAFLFLPLGTALMWFSN